MAFTLAQLAQRLGHVQRLQRRNHMRDVAHHAGDRAALLEGRDAEAADPLDRHREIAYSPGAPEQALNW